MSDIIKKFEESMSDREIMDAKYPPKKPVFINDGTPSQNKIIESSSNLVIQLSEAVEEFELEYPELSIEFKNIQKEMYEMFAAKHMDYGLNNISLGGDILNSKADKTFSLTGLAIRLTDKISRLKNLLVNGKNFVKGEGMEDTFLDVANYGIIGLLVGRDKWKK
tara:strand:- start:139 stop:630 length:492 start_codon:yes stop_codon:yes gene_type:complete